MRQPIQLTKMPKKILNRKVLMKLRRINLATKTALQHWRLSKSKKELQNSILKIP